MKTVPVENCVHCHVCQKNCDFLTRYGIDIGDTDRLKELAYHCFLCGKCTEVCPLHIDGRQTVLDMRRERAATDERTALEKEYKDVLGEKKEYIFRNYRHVTSETVFFPGCNFPSMYPKTNKKISEMLYREAGIGTVYDCCGKPVSEIGFKDEEDRIVAGIKSRMESNGVTEIVVACPNCRAFLGDRLGIPVVSIYTKLHELGLGKAVVGDRQFYVPCPDRIEKQWIEDLKPFVNGEITFVENCQCCGLGGLAIGKEPEISRGFTDRIVHNSDGSISTYCASCTGRIKRNGFDEISHIITEIMETYEKPDTGKSYVNRVLTKFK